MRFYAATNQYGSESSIGFSNTWRVFVFNCKSDRDKYVDDASDISTRSIKKSEIPQYIDAPKPFSGKCRQLWRENAGDIPGFLGEIVVDFTEGGIGEQL